MKTFFTYVWGSSGEQAWPLTFTNKSARKHAIEHLSPNDLVYTVGTRNEPTASELRGRVLNVYRVSNLEVNTQDYRLNDAKGTERFPFALHPIEVWKISAEDNVFRDIVGALTPNHHLQAQTKVFELDEDLGEKLALLSRTRVKIAEPVSGFGLGKVKAYMRKIAPKHEGSFSGKFNEYDTWYVYTLVLRDEKERVLAIKVGYSHDPLDRENDYNKRLATELTGLKWTRDAAQPLPNEDAARKVEGAVLDKYRKFQIPSNQEILSMTDPLEILSAIGTIARDLKI